MAQTLLRSGGRRLLAGAGSLPVPDPGQKVAALRGVMPLLMRAMMPCFLATERRAATLTELGVWGICPRWARGSVSEQLSFPGSAARAPQWQLQGLLVHRCLPWACPEGDPLLNPGLAADTPSPGPRSRHAWAAPSLLLSVWSDLRVVEHTHPVFTVLRAIGPAGLGLGSVRDRGFDTSEPWFFLTQALPRVVCGHGGSHNVQEGGECGGLGHSGSDG